MDQQPYPGPPKLFHVRSLALFNLLALVDVVMIGSLLEVIFHEGVDGLVLFVSEVGLFPTLSVGQTKVCAFSTRFY